MIRVYFYGILRDIVGGATIDLPRDEGRSVREAFATLIARFPELQTRLYDDAGRLSPHMIVFSQNRDILLDEGLDTALDEGAELKIFPQISGGGEYGYS